MISLELENFDLPALTLHLIECFQFLHVANLVLFFDFDFFKVQILVRRKQELLQLIGPHLRRRHNALRRAIIHLFLHFLMLNPHTPLPPPLVLLHNQYFIIFSLFRSQLKHVFLLTPSHIEHFPNNAHLGLMKRGQFAQIYRILT